MNKRKYIKRNPFYESAYDKCWEVVYDPFTQSPNEEDQELGYTIGGQLSAIDFNVSLFHGMFNPGMKVEYIKTGEIFTVVQTDRPVGGKWWKGQYHQELIPRIHRGGAYGN